ncbi:hypothetical protein SOV_46010 [Sporomusa ovata DSM 2662]|uniref:Uncharacterized protein n=1 Tax=Sporomusa ovata TaxID=2378 RepID=A0A0U1KUS6_9FIRM|nr:hypothetical protein SOV_3c08630 [Sporomusa ovata DSM 2662]CQR71096.1 hypothetical protein SpAn4DRAFT_2074 [Sporomusa ovata]
MGFDPANALQIKDINFYNKAIKKILDLKLHFLLYFRISPQC